MTAEGVVREVLARQGLVADILLQRWDPSRQAWLPPGNEAAAELPSGRERAPGRGAGAVIAAVFDGLGGDF